MAKWCIYYEAPFLGLFGRYAVRSVRYWRKWDSMDIAHISAKHLILHVTEQRKPFRTYWAKTH